MVNIDRSKLVTGEIYHVFTKSIAGFRIFTFDEEFLRIKELLWKISGMIMLELQ